MNAHARERSERRPRQRLFGISFERAGGRAGERALERAKLKGFQFDKALSANFSSEQLTGINSRFFFHRSRALLPPPPLRARCPFPAGAALSRAREDERKSEFLVVRSDPLHDFLFDLRSLSSAIPESVPRLLSLSLLLSPSSTEIEICLPESTESQRCNGTERMRDERSCRSFLSLRKFLSPLLFSPSFAII